MSTRSISATGITLFLGVFLISSVLAVPNRVRVINETKSTIYVHKGAYAPAVKLKPGQWEIFYYPFYVVPPNSDRKIATSLIAASAGGRWMTTPNGFTYLSKPAMVICLDYNSKEHRDKTGNRIWTIKQAKGFDPGCKIKGYRQPWFQSQNESNP